MLTRRKREPAPEFPSDEYLSEWQRRIGRAEQARDTVAQLLAHEGVYTLDDALLDLRLATARMSEMNWDVST